MKSLLKLFLVCFTIVAVAMVLAVVASPAIVLLLAL